MTRQEKIKWLKEYRWHILSLIREQENMQKENIEPKKAKQKQKTLVLTKNFYGRTLKVGYENN